MTETQREIKFRAWDKELYEMHGPYDMFDIIDGSFHIKHGFTPMQYTGLKDKNGTEIYEGDIVSSPSTKGMVKFGLVNVLSHNELKAGYNCFYIESKINYKGKETIAQDCLPNYCGVEIIGNIYENPELVRAT